MLVRIMTDFAFEDIHELLRAEKFSTDLQPLTEAHLAQISRYFASKRELLRKQKESNLFDSSARERLKDEIENAKRAVKEFYERREKKIITRAIFTTRTVSKMQDTTNMLKSEQLFYDNQVEILKKSWAGFFSQLSSKTATAESQNQSKPLKDNLRLLKFADSVPELLDSELKKYGPFAKDQTAALPLELAELLIKQNKAEAVEEIKITEKTNETPQNT